jgi:hypothetical protein
MLQAVLHALTSSECTETQFLTILILPVWEDTPWNSAAIRGHGSMSTLIQIPYGRMRFVPAHTQSDEATSDLSLAKWPVEIVFIADEKGRKKLLSYNRIQSTLAPAIQATCRLAPTHTHFFPTPLFTSSGAGPRTATHPLRPNPIRPANPTPMTPLGPVTPPRGRFAEATSREQLSLGHIRPYTLPTRPFKIAELCGGLATGLEAFLKAGYTVVSFT